MSGRPAFATATLAAAAVLGCASAAVADGSAGGTANNSPGIASGNLVQAPVHVPVNACGTTVTVVGVFNPSADNVCGY
ncbi:chaplin [Streptomyces sp. NPDC007205]|uniref:chaplin n=1 Tax=Streptomyces sp. NPDC007205 TaxID=3154316 RepID=UPI0033E11521